jgi:hypothetical protein
MLSYRCRNCRERIFAVWVICTIREQSAGIVKAGQWPKLEIDIPKDFEKALGKHRRFYIQAITMRHNNYGIGSVSYLRRVIEDTTDEMLTFLEEQMVATGSDGEAIEKLRAAKAGNRFEDKVELAAKILPTHLRPGGVNPFADLYRLVSIGLHDKSDSECCEIVDAMDAALKVIYTQLKLHADQMKKYVEATKHANQNVAKLERGE